MEARPDARGPHIIRTGIALCFFTLIVNQSVIGEDKKPDPERLKREPVGTWECELPPKVSKSIRHIKYVTPTHYTWVTYDTDKEQILATSGGTCSVKGDEYEEVCEFASDTHLHLRGKMYGYALKLAGDKWVVRGALGSDIGVDEVWNRMKPGEDQKTNAEPIGRDLLGTWEAVMPPESPKAMRTVKHVTPTHWTWVAYDRERKMVFAAAGGTWFIKSGKYEEACYFTTENFPQARSKSSRFAFKVDGDRWFLSNAPTLGDQPQELWRRVK